ncbi:MAG: DNA topoisomerase 3 [Gammaproteobacteria bacterium]
MRLFIAEKPELAKAIVEGLGGGKRKIGYYECGDDYVTYCIGHMLELLEPEDYDKRYAKWTMADLPLSFIPWNKKPITRTKEQFYIIIELLNKADSIVHAGDPDDEGQLIVDEILQYAKCQKPVKRVLINDNNTKVVRKALDNLRDNREFSGLSAAADARGIGDLLYGVNITRAYTLMAQTKGYQEVLHVGRVQTPIIGLVVRRDRLFESHLENYYYNVTGQFHIKEKIFNARYQSTESDPVDEKGRLISEDYAKKIIEEVKNKPCRIISEETKKKEQHPPLPYNLLKLQTDASRKFGLKPDKVKDITQTLREKYRLITYNRSDSEYLSDEQHMDASGVLAAIAQTAPVLASSVQKSDKSIKSRAFDSAKVSAHHAIIPTEATADLSLLSEEEQKIYLLIARAYIAQFWQKYLYDETILVVEAGDRRFTCRSIVTTQQGWKSLYKKDSDNEDFEIDETDLDIDLRELKAGDTGVCADVICKQEKTKPEPRHTIATLLSDLTRVSKYVKDERLKRLLLDKDKDKTGEHGGIGTPATRDTIIKHLFDRGYLVENGKHIISSPKAREFYDILPEQAKYPDMTALWHEQQKAITAGKLDKTSFVKELISYITAEVMRVKTEGVEIKIDSIPCPKCTKPLRRIKGKAGFFWACSDREKCGHTMNDKAGTPVEKEARQVSELYQCMSCGKGLICRTSKKKPKQKTSTLWWSCSDYPNCKQTYPDIKGKPNYNQRKEKTE